MECGYSDLESWPESRLLDAGRMIFDRIAIMKRPKWAATILRLAGDVTGVKPSNFEHLIFIADHQSEWSKAYSVFTSSRRMMLRTKNAKFKSNENILLVGHLVLMEIVAKVVYNTTDPEDPFDEDSGWWLAVSLKDIFVELNHRQQQIFEQKVFKMYFGD